MTCARTHRARPAAGLCPPAFGSSSAPPTQRQSPDSGCTPLAMSQASGKRCLLWGLGQDEAQRLAGRQEEALSAEGVLLGGGAGRRHELRASLLPGAQVTKGP